MKTLLAVAAVLLAAALGGCVVAPLEPVHAAPVVVKPSHGYHHHRHSRPHWRRWR